MAKAKVTITLTYEFDPEELDEGADIKETLQNEFMDGTISTDDKEFDECVVELLPEEAA